MLVATVCLFATITCAQLPKVANGWRVELVASAPMIQHPTFVVCAPDGRLFIGEDPMDMKPPARDQRGRVVCLHPDGRETVFADQLFAPFGLLYLDGKVYVHHSPKFSVWDDDGSGVGKNRVDLIEQTNPEPWALDWNDHVPANMRLAMDGHLYMAVGDKGIYGAFGRDGKSVALRGGGVLRLRPNATELEIFSTGTRNILDVAINAEDDVFTYDNTDEHDWLSRLTHMADGGFYGYPWDFQPRRSYTLWKFADYGQGAATAAIAYNEDALPPDYRGNLFLCDFGRQEVLRVQIAREGATYREVAHEKLLSANGFEFRPMGIAVAPDGLSFYVTDWVQYDRAKVTVGKIYKVTYTGKNLAAPKPAWFPRAAMGQSFEATTAELTGALAHPAQSVRLTAQRRLAERGREAVKPIVALLGDKKSPPHSQWHAIWALDAIDGGTSARRQILALAKDGESSVRLQAIRQLGTRRVRDTAPLLIRALRDPDALIRFQAATALGRVGDPSAINPLLAALDEKDLFARHAVFTALHRIGRAEPTRWNAIVRGLRSENAPVREGTLFAVRETHHQTIVAALSDFVRGQSDAAERATALRFLGDLRLQDLPWNGKWWKSPYHPALSPRPPKTEAWTGTASVTETLLTALDDEQPVVRQAAAESLRGAKDGQIGAKLAASLRVETDRSAKKVLLRALASADEKLAGTALGEMVSSADGDVLLETIGVALDLRTVGVLMDFLKTNPNDTAALTAAIGALGSLKARESVPLLLHQIKHANLEVRTAAIVALGNCRDAQAVPALVEAFENENAKRAAAEALVKIPDVRALDAYLFGLESANKEFRDRSRVALKKIRSEAQPTLQKRAASFPPKLLRELQGIYPEDAVFESDAPKLDATDYLAFARKNPGDAARGRKIFFDAKGVACSKCHLVETEGGKIGPDLSKIGQQYTRDQLAESVLFPSKFVREDYRQVIVQTSDGEDIAGMIVEDTAEALTLADAAGERHRIQRTQIQSRRTSELSLMPDGIHAGFSTQDFSDLITFLESLK